MASSAQQFRSWNHMAFAIITDPNSISVDAMADHYKYHWNDTLLWSAVYLVLIFTGHRWMRDRAPYHLRPALAIWSGALSVFSFIGVGIVWPEFLSVLREKGFVATYRDNSYVDELHVVNWYSLFVMSKALELFDTAFIVLRKQKLIPLHWIHHVLTLVYSFFVFSDRTGTARWMVAMNFLIHSFMYGYFCLKALRIRIPRVVSVAITTSQIVQMIFGLIINTHMLILLLNGSPCAATFRSIIPGFAMYLLYFYFFCAFFYDSYIRPKPTAKNGLKNSDYNNNNCANQKTTKVN